MNEAYYRRFVPVYIPYFNQPTYLLRMVSKLVRYGFQNVCILNNGSSTPSSQDALGLLSMTKGVQIVEMPGNMGPRWFFTSDYYKAAPDVFVYTDPDLELPDPLPDNFLSRLIELSNAAKIGKVGCAIAVEPDLFSPFTLNGIEFDAVKWESRYWGDKVGEDLYVAPIDTTFTLVNKTHMDFSLFYKALRVAGRWQVRHLPYYKDNKVPACEWAEYSEAKRASKWMADEYDSLRGNDLYMSCVVGGKDAYVKWLDGSRSANGGAPK